MGIIIGVLIIAVISGYIYNNNFMNTVSNNVHNSSTNTYAAYGVNFKYPDNWDADTLNEFDGYLIILSNDESTSVQIYITPNPVTMTDQEAINQIESRPNPSTWTEIQNSTTSLIIDNTTAYKTIFHVKDSNYETMILEQIFFVKNGNTYTIIIQAPENEFNSESSNFDTILNSLKIQNNI